MPASYRPSSYDARPPLRERIAASGLSLAIMGIIIAALLWVTAAPLIDLGSDDPMTTFNVGSEPAPVVAPQSRPRPRSAERDPPAPPQAERPPPPPPPVPTTPGMIVLSKREFAASDIGAMKPSPNESEGAAVADADVSKPVYGPSEAPGGRVMHAADWYREPTRAEMATYMPPQLREGWGVIACKTIERYHVDDCRELGESPGSGIARGMRRAAFQFLVRPPMVDGKPQLGTWVRIRFDVIRGIMP